MKRAVFFAVVAVSSAVACDPPPPIQIAEGEGEGEAGEGEGEATEGEGEGEGDALAAAIVAGCDHDVACDFVDDHAACVADEEATTARYANCEGFEDAYLALAGCVSEGSCQVDCNAPLEALQRLLDDCVRAPIADDIEAFCARSEQCFGDTPGCREIQTIDLVRVGPDCTGANDAYGAAVACLEQTSCEDTIDCDPLFNEFFDQIFFCDFGPAPDGAPFDVNKSYLHDLFPNQECNPAEQGNCFQSLDLCDDSIAQYIVTDVVLPGLYGQKDGTLTLHLQETGGESPETVTFTIEDDGDTLVRDFDGAVFVVNPEGEPFCD